MEKSDIDHILNALRLGTVTWRAKSELKKENRRRRKLNSVYKHSKYKEKIGQHKEVWEYQCNDCKKWFRDREIEVDHIVPVGSFDGSWDEIITRMYTKSNLQLLCIRCHLDKTHSFNAHSDFVRR